MARHYAPNTEWGHFNDPCRAAALHRNTHFHGQFLATILAMSAVTPSADHSRGHVVSQVSSPWRRLVCQTLALSMMVFGLTVLATPQAHAAADAVVSGIVVDSVTNQPLASVTITDSTSGRTTTTAVAGTYSLSLPAGDHVLTATLVGYVPSTTPTLTLTAGQVRDSQAFTLEQYASASGRSSRRAQARGSLGRVVKLFESCSQSPNAVVAATTGPDGSWSLADVAPGGYKVQFDWSQVGFRSGWFGGTTRDTASVVSFTADGPQTIDGTLARGEVRPQARITAQGVGRVSGRAVIDPGGTPVVGATVTATAQRRPSGPMSTDAAAPTRSRRCSSGYYIILVAGHAVRRSVRLPRWRGQRRPRHVCLARRRRPPSRGRTSTSSRRATLPGTVTSGW